MTRLIKSCISLFLLYSLYSLSLLPTLTIHQVAPYNQSKRHANCFYCTQIESNVLLIVNPMHICFLYTFTPPYSQFECKYKFCLKSYDCTRFMQPLARPWVANRKFWDPGKEVVSHHNCGEEGKCHIMYLYLVR